jgi:hypothetical protein
LFDSPLGYARKDFCSSCRPTEGDELIFWRGAYREPGERPRRPFDREALYGVFVQLAQAESPAKAQFRFVLALLLWRKRVIRFNHSHAAAGAAGRETWVFHVPKTGEQHEVARPDVSDGELERLSDRLEALLDGEGLDLEPAEVTGGGADVP